MHVKLKIPRAGLRTIEEVDEEGRRVLRKYPFSQQAGDIVDMSDDEAQRYIDRGYAETIRGIPEEAIQTASAAGERVESGSVRAATVTADKVDQPVKRGRGRPRNT